MALIGLKVLLSVSKYCMMTAVSEDWSISVGVISQCHCLLSGDSCMLEIAVVKL